MKTNTMTRMAVACVMALAGAISFAADIAVGKWERQTIDDDTPAIGVGEGLYLCEKAASVSYTGTGTWTLPLGNVFAFGNTEIGVRNGTLRLENSATPDLVANPPSELNKAALWLDAGKNVETAEFDSTTCAIRWYDARETSAAAFGYGYAEAKNTTGSGPTVGVADGKSYVSFIGYITNADRSFLYKAVGGSVTNYNIRHAFFVQRANSDSRTAPILGNTSAANFFAASVGEYNSMLSFAGNANPIAYSCDYLLDGVNGDATARVSTGTHVHEFTLPPNRTIGVDSLMQDRNSASGGHNIHEILLFTTPLTLLERMRITAYLKAKWSCGGESSLTVNTAAGAEVEIGYGASDCLRMAGVGTAVVGAGVGCEAAHLHGEAVESRPSYVLGDGTSSLSLQAAEYEYRLSPCDRLTVTGETKLSRLAKDTSGVNGSTSVTSGRPFVVSSLDPAITNLSLSGGGNLVLRAPPADSTYVAGSAATATFATTSLSVPAGQTGVETTVEVPVAGSWEIEFNMHNAFVAKTGDLWVDGRNAGYKIQLKRNGNVVFETTPTVVSPTAYNNVDQSRRYLVGNLAAGTYTFRAEGYLSTAIAASISNLAMTFVPNPARETVVPVTDGDFESSRFVRPFFASRDNSQKNNTTTWTFTNAGLSANPAVQTVVSSAMGYSGVYEFMFRSSQLGKYGDNALLWYHNNSTATSPATVFPVGAAGTYKLRLDAVRWMTGTSDHGNVAQNPATGNKRCNEPATVAASVVVNGGEQMALGQIGPVANFTAESLCFPNSFSVAEGDSVTITLEQTTGWAAVQLDNLEFVKVGDGELVINGSVENGSTGWTFDDWTDTYRHVANIRAYGDNIEAYGPTKCDGPYMIRSAQGGRAYQTIAFPAGVFRLSYWSRARFTASTGAVNSQAQTPITFWYAGEGSPVTNEIVKSELSWCTNFIEHVAYFSVPVAGSYVFGFNSEDRAGADVLVDCVSVKQVQGAEAVPDIPEYAEIKVSGGGKLRLDYNGCLNLGRLKVNGKSLMGEVSAEKYPEYISGPGRALVKQRGLVLMYR